ncbi:phosphoribosyltransferase domain-containing protein [Amphritea sp.]|uniref:phosphoribosyltransferase domain-containing protein n=1 Tax=Amphritea sp. TaxID=1872502 RepID=UPI003D0C3C7E
MLVQKPYTIPLDAGKLEVYTEPSSYLMSGLLDFASRENPNRAYLFVSKILGKYIPCRPSAMRQSYQDLNAKISLTGDALVFGVAETATGLGAGIADEIDRNSDLNIYYSQSTRFQSSKPLAFSIDESHSHAPQHLIYDMANRIDLSSIEEVLLVDDEITTGNTLNKITRNMQEYLPNLKRIHWVSLVNWMSKGRCDYFKEQNSSVELYYYSLMKGEFRFKHSSSKDISFPKSTATDLSPAICRYDIGRTGIKVSELRNFVFLSEDSEVMSYCEFAKNEQYVVIGTGEFTYHPFLFAEAMETAGYDVLFLSTGRSPILQGGGISSRLKFYNPTDNANYYLYNLPENRTPIIFYETFNQYNECPLHRQLNCKAAILGNAQ